MTLLSAQSVRRKLRALRSSSKHKILKNFFKCGPGQYGEGDCFLGVTVPDVRRLAQIASHLSFRELEPFLKSQFHEERMLALFVLVEKFSLGSDSAKKNVFNFYLKNLKAVNNWDLVDLSAYKIVGAYLENKPKAILFKMAKSKRMWDRRVAIVSTLHLIRAGELNATFRIAKMLLSDTEDLMHKACGWMLREAGKKDVQALEEFLICHGTRMPRTMLRYAIEKFSPSKRVKYLKIKPVEE